MFLIIIRVTLVHRVIPKQTQNHSGTTINTLVDFLRLKSHNNVVTAITTATHVKYVMATKCYSNSNSFVMDDTVY